MAYVVEFKTGAETIKLGAPDRQSADKLAWSLIDAHAAAVKIQTPTGRLIEQLRRPDSAQSEPHPKVCRRG